MASIIRKPFKYSFKNATIIIVLINAGIFLLEKMFPQIQYFCSLNVYTCLAYKMFWQPFTYMFIHGSFTHVLFNMIGLFCFGRFLISFSISVLVIGLSFYFLQGTVFVRICPFLLGCPFH